MRTDHTLVHISSMSRFVRSISRSSPQNAATLRISTQDSFTLHAVDTCILMRRRIPTY